MKIQMREAIALLMLDGVSEAIARDAIARAAERSDALLLPHGCKLRPRRRGAVLTLDVAGYEDDGADVTRCLSLAAEATRPWPRTCDKCGHVHKDFRQAKQGSCRFYCTWCGDLAAPL